MNLMKKMIFALLVVILLFNFCFSNRVNAKVDAGTLAEPVGGLLLLIGDGLFAVVHKMCYGSLYGQTYFKVKLGKTFGEKALEAVESGALVGTIGLVATGFNPMRCGSWIYWWNIRICSR